MSMPSKPSLSDTQALPDMLIIHRVESSRSKSPTKQFHLHSMEGLICPSHRTFCSVDGYRMHNSLTSFCSEVFRHLFATQDACNLSPFEPCCIYFPTASVVASLWSYHESKVFKQQSLFHVLIVDFDGATSLGSTFWILSFLDITISNRDVSTSVDISLS